MNDLYELLVVGGGSLCLGAAIGLMFGVRSINNEWKRKMVHMDLAEYHKKTGSWQWQDEIKERARKASEPASITGEIRQVGTR